MHRRLHFVWRAKNFFSEAPFSILDFQFSILWQVIESDLSLPENGELKIEN